MNKRLAGTLAAAACFAVAPLAAKQINNFFDDGFPQLIPAVQQLERTENGFTLPREVRISAPAGAEREAKLIAAIIHSRFGAYRGTVVPAGQPAQCRLILAAEGVPESPEGYVLTIGPGGIEIRAREVRGLFYGAQTLGNLIRNNVITTLPGCRITDWPDLGVRGVFLNIRFLKDREVKGFCAALRGLAALKYNTLVLEFAENLPLKNNPFTRHHSPLSEAALKTIMDTARECHMEIIPHLQVLSHDTWMRMHPEYKTKITARDPRQTTTRDWNSSACPEKPLTRELTDYTINETIRLLRPKRFHLAMDEMMLCEWNKCNLCPNGHNLDQLVREIKHYTHLVADQGVEPWMYHDTLCDKDHSGGEAALPFLPKNTVINMWSYRANPTVEYFDFFRKRGFRTTGVSYVMTLENLRAIPLACKEYRNLGSIVTYWGYLRDNFLKSIGIDACAAAGTVLAAEYQWKCSPREVHQWSYDPAWELRRRLGRAPLRRPGSSYAALPIANVCTVKLGADANFPRLGPRETAKLARELAMTPEKFQLNLTTDGKIAAAVLSGGKDGYPATQVVFPVNGYCRGVTMLLTASRPSNYRKLLGKDMRERIRFFPAVAAMIVTYADGEIRQEKLRYRMEINDWNAVCGGYRCRMVVRGNAAADGANYAFYAFDWDNPRPKVRIKSVELHTEWVGEDERIGSAVALLAAVAHVPREIAPAAAAVPEGLGEYHTTAKAKAIRKLTAVDFQNGMGKARFSTEGTFVRPVTREVVADPGSPSGKALKVVLPPVKPGSRPARAIVDVPVPKLEKLGSVAFALRTDSPERIMRSGAYFMNRTTEKHNVIFNFLQPRSNKWQQFEIPFAMMLPPAPGKEVSLDNVSTIRVTVWLTPGDKDVTVWFGPIAASPDAAEYRKQPTTVKVD